MPGFLPPVLGRCDGRCAGAGKVGVNQVGGAPWVPWRETGCALTVHRSHTGQWLSVNLWPNVHAPTQSPPDSSPPTLPGRSARIPTLAAGSTTGPAACSVKQCQAATPTDRRTSQPWRENSRCRSTRIRTFRWISKVVRYRWVVQRRPPNEGNCGMLSRSVWLLSGLIGVRAAARSDPTWSLGPIASGIFDLMGINSE